MRRFLVGGEIINTVLKDTFLFRELDDVSYNEALKLLDGEIRTFGRGEIIYSPTSYERKIGFVISGECEVARIKHDGGRVKLNTLTRGNPFGISAVFSDEDFPTVIYAKRASEIVFITKDELLALIDRFPNVALAIIRFQNDRIAFLNKKIETFSAGTVEEKLACYLLGEHRKRGSAEFAFNKMLTADILGVGRASLYRALDSLTEDAIISFENKKILIKDPEGLERIAK